MRAQPRCSRYRVSLVETKEREINIQLHDTLQSPTRQIFLRNRRHQWLPSKNISRRNSCSGCIGNGGQEEKTNKQEERLFRSSLCTHISMQFSSRKNGTWERFILVSISSIFVRRDSIFVNVASVDSSPQVCAFLSLDGLLAA